MDHFIDSRLDILEMCKLTYDFNPRLFMKKLNNPFSRGEGALTMGSAVDYTSVVCISALFSGTRFYYSSSKCSVYDAQGVESFQVKSKEMCEYYNLLNEAYACIGSSNWHKKRLSNIADRVEKPLREFFLNNNGDEDGLGETIIFGGLEFYQDGSFRRLFIEWHGCNESNLETYMHFYEYAVRIRESIPKLKALLKAYKKYYKTNIKGVGINGEQNSIGDNTSFSISA